MATIKKILIYLMVAILILNIVLMYPTIKTYQPILLIISLLLIAILYSTSCSAENIDSYRSMKGISILIAVVLVIISIYSRFTETLPQNTAIWRWSNTIMYIILLLLVIFLSCRNTDDEDDNEDDDDEEYDDDEDDEDDEEYDDDEDDEEYDDDEDDEDEKPQRKAVAKSTKSNDKINAKKGILSDRESISCNQNHELEYVLKKFGKRQTKKNFDRIKTYCKEYKKEHGSHERKGFYQYLRQNNRLRRLENLKK